MKWTDTLYSEIRSKVLIACTCHAPAFLECTVVVNQAVVSVSIPVITVVAAMLERDVFTGSIIESGEYTFFDWLHTTTNKISHIKYRTENLIQNLILTQVGFCRPLLSICCDASHSFRIAAAQSLYYPFHPTVSPHNPFVINGIRHCHPSDPTVSLIIVATKTTSNQSSGDTIHRRIRRTCRDRRRCQVQCL